MWVSFFVFLKAKFRANDRFISHSRGLTFQNDENFSKIGL